MILDTSFIVDLIRGNANAVSKAEKLQKSSESITTTAISVFEIIQGLGKASRKETEMVYRLFDSIIVLKLDYNAAKEAGEIQKNLKKEGREIDPEDALIAGIAKQTGEKILTKNAKHFSRIEAIKVEEY